MPLLKKIVLILTVLLSIAAGLPKILQMPQELKFLQEIRFNGLMVSLLGFTQVAGGVLLFFPKVRLTGSIVTAAAFAISTVAIFATGNIRFGVISILPILLVGVVAIDSMKPGADLKAHDEELE